MTRPTGPSERRPIVLMNVLALEGNPFLDMWRQAVEASGARPRELSWRAAIGRSDDRPRWVHLQWPERALRSSKTRRAIRGGVRLLMMTTLARLRGARLLITAHNVRSHQPSHPRLERCLWWGLALLCTDLHLMTAAGASPFLKAHPLLRRKRRHVIPHGDYSPVVTPVDRDVARSTMGLPDQGRIFITFGALRGYKGVDTFLDEFRAAANSNDTLLVAGRVLDPSLGDRLAELTRVDPRIRLFEGFLSDSQLACLISAADWVILPYREVLNSGSLLLSLTLRRPAIVPDTPTFREIQSHVGANWVVCSERPLTPQLLTDLGDPPQGAPTLSWCSWARITALLAALW